jgi:hypothetical protein
MNPATWFTYQTIFGQTQRHMHVGNNAIINNLAFNHFNFHLNIIILSKYVSVQNQISRIKSH